MNKNIAILSSLILIFLAAYFLYWKGEASLKKANEKFNALAFTSTSLNCNQSSLEFFVENNLKKTNSYQISIKIDEEEIQKYPHFSVPPQTKKILQLPQKKIKEICQKKKKFKYQILAKNDSNQYLIYKSINKQPND